MTSSELEHILYFPRRLLALESYSDLTPLHLNMSSSTALLPQGAGYGVVVGIGFFFALLMAGISYLQVRRTSDALVGSLQSDLTLR